MELMRTFDIFSTFSGLKPNKSKCEIAGLGALKGVKLALFRMECIDLMFNTITTTHVIKFRKSRKLNKSSFKN